MTNLLDGVNNTCDDMHVWLAPFTKGTVFNSHIVTLSAPFLCEQGSFFPSINNMAIKGKKHIIYVKLPRPCALSCIRIWNYNKSRIHASRGAKDVEIMLDDALIFRGTCWNACNFFLRLFLIA